MCPPPWAVLSPARPGLWGLCHGCPAAAHCDGCHVWAGPSRSFNTWASLMLEERVESCTQSQGGDCQQYHMGRTCRAHRCFVSSPVRSNHLQDPDVTRLLVGPVNIWIWGCQDKHLEELWKSAVPWVGDMIPKPPGSSRVRKRALGTRRSCRVIRRLRSWLSCLWISRGFSWFQCFKTDFKLTLYIYTHA